ncbi:hypothetical protein [Microbulbifer taiwanensis]|uniref:hypothetical protein n=1 Tax=Microbulbifer taiwanensis TaxID=986746 RepID=UPI003620C678
MAQPAPQQSRKELRLRGRWTSSARGYQLELVLPYALTGGALSVTVIDRASSGGGPPQRSAGTLPADGLPGRLVQPLEELQAELDQFARPQLRLAVVDSEGFLLASSGKTGMESTEDGQQSWLRSWIYRRLLAREALPAMPENALPPGLTESRRVAQQWFRGPLQSRIGAASVPVITRADAIIERPLLGRVIALQSAEALQSLTESAAHRLWLISCAAAGTALLLLLGYASWLSWRIRRLHRAARNAVDASGKLRGGFPARVWATSWEHSTGPLPACWRSWTSTISTCAPCPASFPTSCAHRWR